MNEYNLTEEQNIALGKLFPCWSMERDEDGNIVIYPNLQDEEAWKNTQSSYVSMKSKSLEGC